VGLARARGARGPARAVRGGSGALAGVLAATLPSGHPGAGPPPDAPRAGLGAGLAALWRVRELRAVTSATTLAFVGIGSLTTVSVLLATELGSPGGGGVLMTAFAVGALGGSLTLGRITSVEPGRLVRWALAGTGAALAAAVLAPSLAVTAALFAVAGVCDGPLLTATLRIRSEHAPEGARTQVFTLGAGLKLTAASAGAALVGIAADAPAAALLTGIAALLLTAALLHALTSARGPARPARAGSAATAGTAGAAGAAGPAGSTGPSGGSATTAAGRRTPEGP
ncbi:hypothetical protein ACFVZQ_25305, partial [Streptomyces sp. NPDC059538]